MRVITYIDGFNLYFGLHSQGWRRYYWLDVEEVSRRILKPHQRLMRVKYFTSRVSSTPTDPGKDKRQGDYLEALSTLPNTDCFFGHYLQKQRQCRSCGAVWIGYEEKMTDVNIAVELLADAYQDRFDTALVLSADSDLTAPIERVRNLFPAKRVIVVFPPGRTSERLKRAATGWFRLGEAIIRQSQLADPVVKPNGFAIARPPQWN